MVTWSWTGGNDCWLVWVSFWGNENILKLIVVMVYTSVNILKISEFYTLNGWLICYEFYLNKNTIAIFTWIAINRLIWKRTDIFTDLPFWKVYNCSSHSSGKFSTFLPKDLQALFFFSNKIVCRYLFPLLDYELFNVSHTGHLFICFLLSVLHKV